MNSSKSFRPSPALVLAALALVFAMVGTAVAGPDAISDKITKSKVKKIAKKQINKAAPNLSVANADNADNATNLGGVPAAGYAESGLEAVRRIGAAGEPAFQNGYTNLGAAFETGGFYKDGFGIVHIVGDLDTPAAPNAVAFTLPEGYRPAQDMRFLLVNGADADGNAVVRLEADGEFNVFGAEDSNGLGINGITFRTD